MADTMCWISEHDVVSVLDLADALEALRAAFREEGAGRAAELEKTMLGYGDHATLHALGAAFSGFQLAGVKVWTHTPGGAEPLLCMFDARSGALVACVEAFALGQLRTSGTAALATDLLATPDASVLAIIGTGNQALPQVAAVAQVRPITEVRAFSRSPERRETFSRTVMDTLGLQCRAASSPQEAVEGAHVVTLVTRATEAVLLESMVSPGMHVNAVGAIDLERREFEPTILARCETVVTDSLAQTKKLSSEFREFYGADGNDAGRWQSVHALGTVLADGSRSRAPEDVTLFKGMGSGIEDVALGMSVLEHLGVAPGAPSDAKSDITHRLPRLIRQGRAEVPIGPRRSSRP